MADVMIRDACEDDFRFIRFTYLKSYYSNGYDVKPMRHWVYFPNQTAILEEIINRPGVSIKVACSKHEPELILGYVISEGTNTLHYVYVKKTVQGYGIGNQLFDAANLTDEQLYFTHWTEDLSKIKPWDKYNLVYNQYLRFRSWEGSIDEREASKPAKSDPRSVSSGGAI